MPQQTNQCAHGSVKHVLMAHLRLSARMHFTSPDGKAPRAESYDVRLDDTRHSAPIVLLSQIA